MGQIKLTVSLILAGLFAIAIITYAANFAIDNDSAVSILDDPEMMEMSAGVKEDLSGFGRSSEDTYQSIVESTIEEGSGVIPSVGSFAITPKNAMGVVKNITRTGYVKIFGSGSGFGIFLTTLISVLVFMMALYLYKTLRGQPD